MLLVIFQNMKRYFVLCLMTILVMFSIGTLANAQSIDGKAIQPCFPTRENGVTIATSAQREFKIIGKAANPTPAITGLRPMKDFYLVNVRFKDGGKSIPPATTLIGLDTNGKCFNYEPFPAASIALNKYMPQGVARQLSLQKLKWILTQPDGRKYIESTLKIHTVDLNSRQTDNEGLSSEDRYLPRATTLIPEEAWAMRQLGFKIPKEAVILPAAKEPWKFDKAGSDPFLFERQ